MFRLKRLVAVSDTKAKKIHQDIYWDRRDSNLALCREFQYILPGNGKGIVIFFKKVIAETGSRRSSIYSQCPLVSIIIIAGM